MIKKKGLIIGIVTAAAVAAGGAAVFAANGSIAKTNSIGEEAAKRFACSDAGVDASDVVYERIDFEFERGKYVYEVEFNTREAEYDYTLDAGTGEIIEKSIEQYAKQADKTLAAQNADPVKTVTKAAKDNGNDAAKTTEKKAADTGKKSSSENTSGNAGNSQAQPAAIGIERAKEIALEDAGVDAGSAVFETAKQDMENGTIVYDIEFFVKGTAEYDYEIDAYTGGIRERSSETWDTPYSAPASPVQESVPDQQMIPEDPVYYDYDDVNDHDGPDYDDIYDNAGPDYDDIYDYDSPDYDDVYDDDVYETYDDDRYEAYDHDDDDDYDDAYDD